MPIKMKLFGSSAPAAALVTRWRTKLAERGAILALSARNADDLAQLKNTLGDQHQIFVLDVTDEKQVQETVQAVHLAFGRIDRVIFLAAAYTPMKLAQLDLVITKQIIEVNLLGVFYVVHAVLPLLAGQKTTGQIALCGSVAGYNGLPGGQPYSATKAGIINLAESLYSEAPKNIDIKLISPGFVRTGLTAKNDFTMPMIISPEAAAQAIANGLLTTRFEIHFPKRFTLFLKLLRILPYRLYFWLTGRLA